METEYYKEWLAYITEGIDLNPYIDRDAIKDPSTPKDIQLERVLSYKIDTEKLKGSEQSQNYLYSNNLWLFRQKGIKEHREELEGDYSNIGNIKLLPFYFSYQTFTRTGLRDYADSIPAHPGLHDSELPFLIQAYREYESKPKDNRRDISFEEFIQTHPAVFYNSDASLFLLPHVDEERNIMSGLFRNYNEFVKCIEEDESNIKICDKIEDKKAFIKFMLETYK